jgi:hypothetical protein
MWRKRLDKSFAAIFRRVKHSETLGSPHFKPLGCYHSLTYAQGGYVMQNGRQAFEDWVRLTKTPRYR